ncbi:thiol peroxidase, Tpx-type [Hydrogenimonas sp.]|nr:thiol peroxidase, Tpx-type [Hydrogenimonas sp.]
MATTKLKGNEVKLAGNEVNVGDIAPVVKVTDRDLGEIQIGGQQGKAQIVVVVPSLDTDVCAAETRRFNEEAAKIENAEVVVVSMDLPFAMKRFCTTEGIENLKTASDYKNRDFAEAYGVLIAEGPLAGLTCRAVFIIDANGVVTYKQIVPEITEEPDYEEVLNAAKAATSTSCCGTCQ